MVLTNPNMKPRMEFNHYEDIHEYSENLSKVTPVYGSGLRGRFIDYIIQWLNWEIIVRTNK